MPSYFTHDNGGRPFMVNVDTKNHYLEVFKFNQGEFDKHEDIKINKRKEMTISYDINIHDQKIMAQFYDESVYKTSYREIFVGNHEEKGDKSNWGLGNSILVNKNNTQYIYIGHMFEPGDHIKEYYSPIGNSDVPYPYAIGNKNVYFMIEDKYVSLSGFTDDELANGPYNKLYGHSIPHYFSQKHKRIKPKISEDEKNVIKMYELWQKLYIKKFNKKILVKRVW